MRIAVGQFAPDSDPAVNAGRIADLAARAAEGGAALLLLPEGSLVRFVDDPAAAARAAEPLDGPFAAAVVDASSNGLAVAAGTFTPFGSRVRNTLLVADHGDLVASYHKVHLYDAFSFLESEQIAPGAEPPPVVDIAGVPVGFATCYDLRFPELFRLLAARGADVLAVAAAWVVGPFKEEHWLTLLKARAIENTCYVVAAGQIAPKTIGRSAAFDPMGLALLDLGVAAEAIGSVDIDPNRISEVRAALPSLANRRFRIDDHPTGAGR